MLALSTLCYLFYNNYNTTPLLHEVYPKAYLRVQGIKDSKRISFPFLSFFPGMPQKSRNSTDRRTTTVGVL